MAQGAWTNPIDSERSIGDVNTVKNSVGVWAFGPAVTRFVPPGYHAEVDNEDMVEKTKRICGGLSDLLDGLEYHYPTYGKGALVNPDESLRRQGVDTPKRGIDLCAGRGELHHLARRRVLHLHIPAPL